MEAKEYDCRNALLAIALAMANDEEPDLRDTLAKLTDIPEERLDFATSEIGQTLDSMRMIVGILKAVVDESDDDAALREAIASTIGGAKWRDDDERDLTLKAYPEDDPTFAGEPMVTVKTKLADKD